MPPRHNYWTILFGDKPTAFRAATEEELLPTFKQIKAKNPDAVMMWFARGKLWRTEEEARETFERQRSDRPRGPRPESQNRSAKLPDSPHTDRPRDPRGPRPEWQNRGPKPPGPPTRSGEGGAWRDKPHGDRPRGPKPEWQNRGPKPPGPPTRSGEGGAWRDKPPGDRPPGPRPEWKDRGPKPEWHNRGSKPDGPSGTPGGAPPGDRPLDNARDRRGRDWRPGGAHKDPRDRFKVPRDVKRAKFKQNLHRARTNPPPPRKKKDEE